MDHCTSVPHPLFTLESGRPAHLPVVSACSVPRNISTLSTSYNRLTFKQVFPGYLSFPVHSLLDFSRWPIFFLCVFSLLIPLYHIFILGGLYFLCLFSLLAPLYHVFILDGLFCMPLSSLIPLYNILILFFLLLVLHTYPRSFPLVFEHVIMLFAFPGFRSTKINVSISSFGLVAISILSVSILSISRYLVHVRLTSHLWYVRFLLSLLLQSTP